MNLSNRLCLVFITPRSDSGRRPMVSGSSLALRCGSAGGKSDLLGRLNLSFLQSENVFLPRRKVEFIKRPVSIYAIWRQFGVLITLPPVYP